MTTVMAAFVGSREEISIVRDFWLCADNDMDKLLSMPLPIEPFYILSDSADDPVLRAYNAWLDIEAVMQWQDLADDWLREVQFRYTAESSQSHYADIVIMCSIGIDWLTCGYVLTRVAHFTKDLKTATENP